jgi:hypothetical protein
MLLWLKAEHEHYYDVRVPDLPGVCTRTADHRGLNRLTPGRWYLKKNCIINLKVRVMLIYVRRYP